MGTIPSEITSIFAEVLPPRFPLGTERAVEVAFDHAATRAFRDRRAVWVALRYVAECERRAREHGREHTGKHSREHHQCEDSRRLSARQDLGRRHASTPGRSDPRSRRSSPAAAESPAPDFGHPSRKLCEMQAESTETAIGYAVEAVGRKRWKTKPAHRGLAHMVLERSLHPRVPARSAWAVLVIQFREIPELAKGMVPQDIVCILGEGPAKERPTDSAKRTPPLREIEPHIDGEKVHPRFDQIDVEGEYAPSAESIQDAVEKIAPRHLLFEGDIE